MNALTVAVDTSSVSKQQWLKTITEDNERFEALPKKAKRVVIAQDVIARIRYNMLRPDSVFLSMEDEGAVELHEDLQCPINEQVCTACAKGSMFIALVGRANHFKYRGDFSIQSDSVEIEKTKELFTQKQLDLMEIAFERNTYDWAKSVILEAEEDRAIEFGNGFNNPDDRLIGICENIIENNGTFKI